MPIRPIRAAPQSRGTRSPGKQYLSKPSTNGTRQGAGPRLMQFGRHARYRLADVIAWENGRCADRSLPGGTGGGGVPDMPKGRPRQVETAPARTTHRHR